MRIIKNKLRQKLLLLLIISCISVSADEIGLGKHAPSKPDVCKFVIESNAKYQTIDNFGASDAWSFQFIGLWPEEKRQKMAEWLFSTQNDSHGQPRGIGLSLWRFNIGAGSAEQGDSSHINNVWTRTECFLQPDGKYNWEKQKGQLTFLKLARDKGVKQFLGFLNSPPVYWTYNDLATNIGRSGTFNLRKDKYKNFALFLDSVVVGLKKNYNIELNYISPFNEPDGHWNWLGTGQEGTPATKYEIAGAVRIIGEKFNMDGIKTKILVPESSDYNCMYGKHELTQPDRGYQIQSYFNPDSISTYIGSLANVPRLMAAHSYWTNTPLDNLRKARVNLNKELSKNHVRFWQTELCVMGNDTEIGGGGGKDLTMKTALYIARIIHHDLVFANASAWQWWRAVATGDYKDGLIYANPDNSLKNGTFTDSKLMWVLGNYSRFIRPGAIRLGITGLNNHGELIPEGDTNPLAIMISAYENIDNTAVVVIINYSKYNKEINIKWKGKAPENWKPYLTDEVVGDNLKPLEVISYGENMTIPPRSVITYVGK